MSREVRVAVAKDIQACLRVRSEWLNRFFATHAPEERWCPAGVPVPRIEDETTLQEHLAHAEAGRSGAVRIHQGEAEAYILWRPDKAKRELRIEGETPRIS